MLKLLIVTIFTFSLYAQNLYDSNCLNFVKSNQLVKANTDADYLLQKNRTERYFYWEKINARYSQIVHDKTLQDEARDRYSRSKNTYKINKCKTSIETCNAYKAYCIEEVASNAMSEEITEWNDRVQNCQSKKYRQLHPSYCDKDFTRSLLYLKRMANDLAKTNRSKSPDVARFFEEAKEQFQKYYDQMGKLLASIESEKQKERDNNAQAIKKEKVENTLQMCRDLIKGDDNDIGDKSYVDKILMNYSCPQLSNANELNETALNDLEKMIENIDKKNYEMHIYPEITDLAMNQSVKATAATYLKFFSSDLDLNDSRSKHIFVQKICKELDEDYCKRPSIKAAMYAALNELNEETRNNKINKISDKELFKDIQKFNATLKQANSFCHKINAEAKKIEKENKCTSEYQYMDPIERRSSRGSEVALACQKRKQKKYQELKDLNNSNNVQAQMFYAEATGTISGHLLVTEDFRDKVDLPSKDWINERCINGDGKAFNTVLQEDIDKGLKDLYKLNIKEISDISEQKNNPKKRKSIIKDYLKNNPNTIAELLEQNPEEEYAKAICGFVREINSSDYYKVWGERAVVGVGVVAGVALSATGVGAPIGVPLLATVGSATALEAGSIIYDINDINYNIRNKRQAASTGQLDLDQALDEIGSGTDKLYSRKIDLALTLSFGTLDLVSEGAKSARLFYKTNEALKTKKILGLNSELTQAGTKKASAKITQGFNNFSYHAKRAKLLPENLKTLSDKQKIELGAIYSELSHKDQKLMTKLLADIKSPDDLSSMLAKLSDVASTKRVNGKLDFDALYSSVRDDISTLPNGVEVKTAFKKSDELLYLNNQRLGKNVDQERAKELSTKLDKWYNSSEVRISDNLAKDIEAQLQRNGVEYKNSGNGYLILPEGNSELSRFTKRMNELGVQVKYDPSALKANKMNGGYDPNANVVFIDNYSVVDNKVTPITFHEGSHVYGIEKYLQGYDDDFNISFKSDFGGPIYTPPVQVAQKNKSIPYSEGFWAHETKVFSNEIRQNAWAQKPNIDIMRKNTETLELLNQNAIANSDRVIEQTKLLSKYIDDKIPSMAQRHISVSQEMIKDEKVYSFDLQNLSVSTGPERHHRADIRTSIKAVTQKQKELVKKYLETPSDPVVLKEILDEFKLKASSYKEATLNNDAALEALSLKVKSLKGIKEVSKADQKELIKLSANISNTTKTPIPASGKFERRFASARDSKAVTKNLKKSEILEESKIEIKNSSDNQTPSLEEIMAKEKSVKEKQLNWSGGFEIKGDRPYPSLNHVIKGNIAQGPNGPILKEGMHTDHSLKLLLKKNKTYADEMLTPEGHIKSKYFRKYPNGVIEVRLPILDNTGSIVKGSKGTKTVPKNLFPNTWDKDKILRASKDIKNNTNALTYAQGKKGSVFVYEGIYEDVSMRVIVSSSGELITAYPVKNVGAVRSISTRSFSPSSVPNN